MVRLSFPPGFPVSFPFSRRPKGLSGNFGKRKKPEAPDFGNFGNFGKADPAGFLDALKAGSAETPSAEGVAFVRAAGQRWQATRTPTQQTASGARRSHPL